MGWVKSRSEEYVLMDESEGVSEEYVLVHARSGGVEGRIYLALASRCQDRGMLPPAASPLAPTGPFLMT